uniref:Aminotransferase-like plant mobile domain-containing protein n=1 Tax=Fagus sylvatica TaxID=28930 RepID=A0A2N9GDE3_FAGSY
MDVNKSLSEECKSQLQTTPFGWLLNLHCNIEASGRMLEVMVASWNADARAFQVGDRLIPFTLYDIALILGLPVRGEPIDCNQSHSGGVRLYIALVFSYFLFPTTSKKVNPSLLPLLDDRANLGTYAWGKAVYDFLVSGLSRAASSMQAKKGRGNLHIQGCTALLQIWACEHLGIGQKNAEINQPFPRFLAWTHQRMYTKKAREAFSNSANVLSVLVAMPWEQEFNVVEEAMETLQETHGSSHPTIKRGKAQKGMMGLKAGPSSCGGFGRNGATRRATRRRLSKWIINITSYWFITRLKFSRPNEVDSNEVAISTETYELTGREVSSLLGDQAQDDGSRWISIAVVDTFKDVLMEKLKESGHPPPYINFIISVHGGTMILGSAQSTSGQRGKRTRKGKQPVQDDQPRPESGFRPSWVRALPGKLQPGN